MKMDYTQIREIQIANKEIDLKDESIVPTHINIIYKKSIKIKLEPSYESECDKDFTLCWNDFKGTYETKYYSYKITYRYMLAGRANDDNIHIKRYYKNEKSLWLEEEDDVEVPNRIWLKR